MKKLLFMLCAVQVSFMLFSSSASAQGISVDAGMTPGEDRWMIRTMVHFMQRDNDSTSMNRSMKKFTNNNVLAYGLKRNLTLIIKHPIVHRAMSMAGSTMKESGRGDTSLAVKYGLYRRNTMDYSFGLATTIGLIIPSGAQSFSSETVDLKPGIYMSLRLDRWATDFAMAYSWNGLAENDDDGINPGNEFSADWALAYRFSVGDSGDISWAPVLEVSYKNIFQDHLDSSSLANTGESVLYISPGAKLTKSSLILEALFQIPVWQEQTGIQLERGNAVLAGIRYMF